MTRMSKQERQELLATIKAEFDERLARIAADPVEWVEFIEQVATFGARYSLGNQILLMVQAEQRGITPRCFLPYGNAEATSGWRRHQRQVRKGETAFKIWAPVRRRPSEQEAQVWESAGRTVQRDNQGRPTVQVVGFRLSSTFDPLSRDSSLRRGARSLPAEYAIPAGRRSAIVVARVGPGPVTGRCECQRPSARAVARDVMQALRRSPKQPPGYAAVTGLGVVGTPAEMQLFADQVTRCRRGRIAHATEQQQVKQRLAATPTRGTW